MNYFLAMAENNRWANDRLLTACGQLSLAAFEARRTGFFPSIQATLRHVLVVDQYYLSALAGDVAGQDYEAPQALSFSNIEAAQRALDLSLVRFCRPLNEAELARLCPLQRTEGVVYERVDRLLLHLFEHQLHHRGQVHAMLSGTTVPPPQLDEFFLACDGPLRAAEMRRLDIDDIGLWSGPV